MAGFADAAQRLATRAATAAAVAGGLVLLAGALLVSLDVVLRRAWGISMGGADELSGYALAIGSTWSFAFVLLQRGNVRVDALYQLLPARLAAVCDMLALLALLGFFGLVAWHGWGVVAQSWTLSARSNSALGVPLVVPQGLWWLGYAWFLACGLLLLARSFTALLAGDWAAVNRMIGARSTRDEAQDEVQGALQARAAP